MTSRIIIAVRAGVFEGDIIAVRVGEVFTATLPYMTPASSWETIRPKAPPPWRNDQPYLKRTKGRS